KPSESVVALIDRRLCYHDRSIGSPEIRRQHPVPSCPSSGFCAVEFCGHLSGGVAVEVVCELLTRGLLWSSLFGSYRSRSSRTFFTLFAFFRVRCLSRLLVCGLCCSARIVRSLLVLIAIVAGSKHNQSEK